MLLNQANASLIQDINVHASMSPKRAPRDRNSTPALAALRQAQLWREQNICVQIVVHIVATSKSRVFVEETPDLRRVREMTGVPIAKEGSHTHTRTHLSFFGSAFVGRPSKSTQTT